MFACFWKTNKRHLNYFSLPCLESSLLSGLTRFLFVYLGRSLWKEICNSEAVDNEHSHSITKPRFYADFSLGGFWSSWRKVDAVVCHKCYERSPRKRVQSMRISLGSLHVQCDYIVLLFDAMICLISFKRWISPHFKQYDTVSL